MTEPYDMNAAIGDDPKAIVRDWRYPPRAGGCVLLVSADDIYLRRFVGGVVASALLNAVRVHINAIGPAPVTLAALDALAERFPGAVSLSVEADHMPTETRRPYCAASRFFCAHDLVNYFNFDVYTIDIDSLIMRPIPMPNADYGLFFRDIADPRFKVAAGLVFIGHGGGRFLDAMTTFWARRRPAVWYDDQACLVEAHDHCRGEGLRAARLTDRLMGFNYRPELAVWSAKGDRKIRDEAFLRLSRTLSTTLWRRLGQPSMLAP